MVARAAEENELLGVFDRQQPQQHFVDERENGRVRANSERNRPERDDGEDG